MLKVKKNFNVGVKDDKNIHVVSVFKENYNFNPCWTSFPCYLFVRVWRVWSFFLFMQIHWLKSSKTSV